MEQQTIKEVRKNLKAWGKFWRKKESIQGFATRSIFESIGGGGGRASSDSIVVPSHIELLTTFIDKLQPKCIRAIRARYIHESPLEESALLMGFDSKRSAEFWLVKAERELLLQTQPILACDNYA